MMRLPTRYIFAIVALVLLGVSLVVAGPFVQLAVLFVALGLFYT